MGGMSVTVKMIHSEAHLPKHLRMMVRDRKMVVIVRQDQRSRTEVALQDQKIKTEVVLQDQKIKTTPRITT